MTVILEIIEASDGRKWSFDEVQALLNQVGSFTVAARRLGLKAHVFNKLARERGLMTPTEIVRTLAQRDLNSFKDCILRFGSIEKAAKGFNCSTAHVRKVLIECGVKLQIDRPTREEILEAMQIFGSVLLAARLLNTTTGIIKAEFPEWKDHRDPLKTGKQAVSTGRIGEDYWASIRGEHTLQNCSYENPSHPDYDFVDRELGDVNVKTASFTQAKKTALVIWTWEVNPTQKADGFPLVYLDRNRRPLGHHYVPRDEGDLEFPTKLRHVLYANGNWGVSYRISQEDYLVLERELSQRLTGPSNIILESDGDSDGAEMSEVQQSTSEEGCYSGEGWDSGTDLLVDIPQETETESGDALSAIAGS